MKFLVKYQQFKKKVDAESFKQLKEKIRTDFRYLIKQSFRLEYYDQEQDVITLSNEEDYQALSQGPPQEPLDIYVQDGQDSEAEEDPDEFNKSLNNSFKILQDLKGSFQKRKESSASSYKSFRAEPRPILETTEDISDSVDQNYEIQQSIEKCRRTINQLEKELQEKRPVPLALSEEFERFIHQLEQSEVQLQNSKDELDFENNMIQFRSLSNDFAIMLKQRERNIQIQWDQKQTKIKFIKKNTNKIKKKKQEQSLNQSQFQKVDKVEEETKSEKKEITESIKQQDPIEHVSKFYNKNINDKALIVSQVLNIPLNHSLFDYVQTYEDKSFDELVILALESKKLLN